MFSFQTTEVFKKAKQFHLGCKKLCPAGSDEKYVADQLSRASYSIPLNIAEGSAKFSKPDRRNYFTTARGSLFECIAILEIMHAEGKLAATTYMELTSLGEELSKMLYTMVKNLQ
ncbi:MAG: four helix bundle protein [Bacteroidetes bacterium]|nr:four helix bundle protein [Bacteroidota bacterium]